MRRDRVPIAFEDENLIVCEKPAGMPVQSDRSGDPDLLTLMKHRLYMQGESEEEPYLAVVHRLDRPVGGLMVLAKTSEAAAELSRQIREDEFEKNYQAVVCGTLKEDFGTLEHFLLHNPKTNTTSVVEEGTPGAKLAVLDYEMIDCIQTKQGFLTWVLVNLHTGRHHQIRVQFAAIGNGLFGDRKYNPLYQKEKKKGFVPLGLYSTRLAFNHPVTGERKVFKTEPVGKAFDLMDVEAY